ncbi:undecaprenyl-diphosphate phosphatase [Alteriqipengyuania flavescens]|uniref:undecaprenyl-diphosphate phosphatase n=1 Tax=Alteriqipengyuania flavescens TaxID=3053610 RepID=UPI0025B2F656|nr:undecaprenyl-diphosphate phosphatase [Alteriqipengyuania flavescens]WJY19398.1 undecaprenyl-diphosphate phosphatase [Alteriqipengyuania flavescens]WJY25340.1 undecaprenyl-diphosphate phosphatase [Alteriqipengyuania flavescens]
MNTTLTAILLGIVEGLTEFVPVSSTGHLILASELFGYDAAQWAMFNVVIQLGAILAVVYQYWTTFWNAGMGVLKLESEGLRFARNIILAFVPSAILGLALKDYIDIMLGSPSIVAWALIIGGIAILGIEKVANPRGDTKVADLPMKQVIGVGLAQCLAMVPGVSRSGATIMGALAMGINRKTAAEFSFFLAVPTMIGATTLELIQKGDELTAGTMTVGWYEIAIGFAVSFVVALVVIRAFVAYVSKHGFAPFAWYRIVIGAAAVAWLALR